MTPVANPVFAKGSEGRTSCRVLPSQRARCPYDGPFAATAMTTQKGARVSAVRVFEDRGAWCSVGLDRRAAFYRELGRRSARGHGGAVRLADQKTGGRPGLTEPSLLPGLSRCFCSQPPGARGQRRAELLSQQLGQHIDGRTYRVRTGRRFETNIPGRKYMSAHCDLDRSRCGNLFVECW